MTDTGTCPIAKASVSNPSNWKMAVVSVAVALPVLQISTEKNTPTWQLVPVELLRGPILAHGETPSAKRQSIVTDTVQDVGPGGGGATRHSGTMILLGPGGAATVTHNTGKIFLPLNMVCHDMDSPYGAGLDLIEPGPIDGYQGGSMCTTDVECKSRQCLDRRCAAA